jgi:predicted Zn-dependent peptidase
MKQYENNTALASAYFNAFIHRQDWKSRISFLDQMKEVSKEELVAFANEFYRDNYVVVFKRQGEDEDIVKVENPEITPVEVNRDIESDYLTEFKAIQVEDLQPVFVDYEEEIGLTSMDSGVPVEFIENTTNELFSLNIIFDMGRDHNRKLPLAVGYLDYLGTDKLSPEQVRKEFYKLGISYGVNTGAERSYVSLSGLQENMEQGLRLLEDLWSNAVADQESYDKFVAKILKAREDGKSDKGNILWTGLWNYGKYGEHSRLRNIYTAEEMQKMDPTELVDLVKDLKNYKQRIFYYGNARKETLKALNSTHKVAQNLKDYPEPVEYEEVETGDKVYYVDFDMVQAELVMLAKSGEFDADKLATSQVFNSYFGGSMASIVFQDLRESKSLAYSAYAGYSNAGKLGDQNYTYSYIGTQANKLPEAVDAMMSLMTDMPEVEQLFQAAKTASLKKIAAQRITKESIFWNYEALKRRGIDHDNRREIYESIQNMDLDDLRNFFDANIKENSYTTLVIGNKEDLELEALKKLGEVKELDIDYLFNYRDTEVKQ